LKEAPKFYDILQSLERMKKKISGFKAIRSIVEQWEGKEDENNK
jgi:hypothetical protein